MSQFKDNLDKRKFRSLIFRYLCFSASAITIGLLVLLISRVAFQGWLRLNWDFINNLPSRIPTRAGIIAGLVGSLWLLLLVTLFSIPLGVATAVYIEEYLKPGKLKNFIKLNIANLAGVPSIVYGILGLAVFVRFMHLERSLLAGGLTLSILCLPIIIITSSEALMTVSNDIRLAAYALGSTKRLVVWYHVLPTALPNIMTGIILSLSRAIGETAPLLIVGGMAYVSFVPANVYEEYTALPIQIYNWTALPKPAFHELAASGILVLLTVLLGANAIAIYIRHHFSGQQR